MTHTRTKLTVAGVGLLIAVGYLAFAGMKEGWVYHVPVEQFMQDKSHQNQRARLAGRVLAEGLAVNAGELAATFTLAGTTARLPVAYHGVIPEMFKADCEVVVEGQLDPSSGVFKADTLMTKCASKYQPGEDHARKVKQVS
jgi:cytochrome c-type biogenesis protein CcmE